MKSHDWKQTFWQNEKGNKTTIQEVLLKLQNEPIVRLELSTLEHIPSTCIEENRRIEADLSFPIIVQENHGKYQSILDGHHRRQKAIDEKRTHILAKILKEEVISESR